jgi:hypothetical protein
MVDLAELARNLTVDVGNDGLNGLRDSSRFSEYAEVMIWIENVARQPHQSFPEIVQKFEDKVAELNLRYSIDYLLERLRTERASYWDYNGGWSPHQRVLVMEQVLPDPMEWAPDLVVELAKILGNYDVYSIRPLSIVLSNLLKSKWLIL